MRYLDAYNRLEIETRRLTETTLPGWKEVKLMTIESKDAVTLGSQIGGKDAQTATHEQVLVLRKLLRRKCKGPYSDIVREVALVLRIDGEIQSWGKSGVEKLRLQKKSGYITADIFVPCAVWSSSDASLFPSFLTNGVQSAIAAVGEHLKQRKVEFDLDKLKSDVSSATAEYLNRAKAG